MLPKTHRLTKSVEIQRVFSRGRRFITPFFAFNWLPNKLGITRIAFVVGVKVAKRANTRNLIKRRAREIVREHISELPLGIDLVITARSGVVTYVRPKQEGKRTPHALVADFDEIKKQILFALHKIH